MTKVISLNVFKKRKIKKELEKSGYDFVFKVATMNVNLSERVDNFQEYVNKAVTRSCLPDFMSYEDFCEFYQERLISDFSSFIKDQEKRRREYQEAFSIRGVHVEDGSAEESKEEVR